MASRSSTLRESASRGRIANLSPCDTVRIVVILRVFADLSLARPALGIFRLDAEDADLRAEPSLALLREPWRPRLRGVGVIGVEHEVHAVALERGEVGIVVQIAETEDLGVEGQAAIDVAHEQVEREPFERAAVVTRSNAPFLCLGPLRGHGRTTLAHQSGNVNASSAAPARSAAEAPKAASTPPARAPAAAPASCQVWSAARIRGRSISRDRRATASSTAIVAVSPLTNALPPKSTKSSAGGSATSAAIETSERIVDATNANDVERSLQRPAIGVHATCAIRCVSAKPAAMNVAGTSVAPIGAPPWKSSSMRNPPAATTIPANSATSMLAATNNTT